MVFGALFSREVCRFLASEEKSWNKEERIPQAVDEEGIEVICGSHPLLSELVSYLQLFLIKELEN